jgi:hypothetical protein
MFTSLPVQLKTGKILLIISAFLVKQYNAGKRDLDVEIELKRGTLVITYTPAAYEIYKQAIYKYYDEHQHKTYVIYYQFTYLHNLFI